ncbi:DUF3419 family protein [Candidatus Riflebacteria bacterium]
MEVVYSQCWEDSHLNTKSLKIKESDTCVSITSGGCNTLALLLDGAKRVISFDLNPAQNYLLKLKVEAIKLFEHRDFCDFLGTEFIDEKPDRARRLQLWQKLKPHLNTELRDFWEQRTDLIKDGLINCGKIEKYFQIYAQILRRLYPNFAFQRFFTTKSLKKQQELYHRCIDKRRWRFLNVLLLNKWALGFAKGFHSFEHVEELNLEGSIYKKVRHLCLSQLLSKTPFLPQIIVGKYPNRNAVPEYLKEKNYKKLIESLPRLEIKLNHLIGVLEEFEDGGVDKFNVSNIFEWMTQEIFEEQLDWIHRKSSASGIMAYRYTFAKKKPLRNKYLEMFEDKIEEAKQLHDIDMSFMYSHFIIHHIKK